MKVKPEEFLNNIEELSYNKILITGNEVSLMAHVRDYVINNFKKKNYFIDITGRYNAGLAGDLFSDKKILFVLKDYSPKKDGKGIVDVVDQVVLMVSPNNKKVNAFKSLLSKSKDGLVIDCYSLDRKSKEITLKYFVEKNNLQLSKDVFWYIVENFERNYVLFIKQLQTLNLFNKRIESISVVENIIFVENKFELNKIFFNILKKNAFLINTYNKSIYSQSDFYIFLNSIKLYLGIISGSKNKKDAGVKLPGYLFAEKEAFLKIYDQLDKNKLLKIYNNLFRIESLVRENSSLYLVLGLRFLLNTKRVVIS